MRQNWSSTASGHFNRISALPPVQICKTALYGVKSLFPYIFRISSSASCWCFFLRFSLCLARLLIIKSSLFCKKGRLPLSLFLPGQVLGRPQHSGSRPSICPVSGIKVFHYTDKNQRKLNIFLEFFIPSIIRKKRGCFV